MIAPDTARSAYVAAFVVGVYGVLMAGLAPLLLGTLVAEGHLTAAQLGLAATAELVTMGLAAGAAGFLTERVAPRMLALASVVAIIVLDVATASATGGTVILLRALAGAPSGMLVGIVTAMIVRSAQPARQAGMYLTIQTVAQLACAALISGLVAQHHGAATGFFAIAALGLPVAIVAMGTPVRLAPFAANLGMGLPDIRGWLALAAAFCFFAGILGIWIYIEPLAHQAGLSSGTGGLAVVLALAGQVAGGVLGAATVQRWPCRFVLIGATAALIVAAAIFATLPGQTAFLATAIGFGMLWAFASPYFTRLLIDVDPTHRAAMLGSAALLLGCATGPSVAALSVSDGDVRGCLTLGTGLLIVTGGIVLLLPLLRRVGSPAFAVQSKDRS
ncbi:MULTISPECIES: MFS transporter [unclassified Sphingomonas]|uniref:MFS transporter n=1 Tax=unclassified Sphingomonas TaxID=196159 RepID=UPI000700FAF2|nr:MULTISPECIES: MFS transporter [unclassified Sphingomonas]KQS46990.1 hypothetical protein ASG20_17280 [Sphingomonas sp. Leaf198]